MYVIVMAFVSVDSWVDASLMLSFVVAWSAHMQMGGRGIQQRVPAASGWGQELHTKPSTHTESRHVGYRPRQHSVR